MDANKTIGPRVNMHMMAMYKNHVSTTSSDYWSKKKKKEKNLHVPNHDAYQIRDNVVV